MNMNVSRRLSRIEKDLSAVLKHCQAYSGFADPGSERERTATFVLELAARFIDGTRNGGIGGTMSHAQKKTTLEYKVRKAIGYTYP